MFFDNLCPLRVKKATSKSRVKKSQQWGKTTPLGVKPSDGTRQLQEANKPSSGAIQLLLKVNKPSNETIQLLWEANKPSNGTRQLLWEANKPSNGMIQLFRESNKPSSREQNLLNIPYIVNFAKINC